MISVRPPSVIRWLSPRYLLCDLPSEEKIIYLTFDDGPIPEATPEVLDILRRFDARATFFMVGDNVRKYPAICGQVLHDGHAAGNHTFHHLNGWKTSPGAYMEDVRMCRELVPGRLFRPPYGRCTPTQYFLLRNKFRFVLWSVLTGDYNAGISPEQCLRNAVEYTGNGSIVVFHDNLKSIEKVRYALPRFLEHFSGQGYRFEALDSLR